MSIGNTPEHNNLEVHDFPSWLQREFLKRRKKNGGYSIRAFANFLGIASGSVSHLLSGKRKPSRKFVEKLFLQMDVSRDERDIVLRSLTKERASSSSVSTENYQLIAYDSLKVVAEWYHFAIVELTSVEDFKSDPSWIARQLRISVPEAKGAIQRLVRLGMLKAEGGTLVRSNPHFSNAEDGVTSSAHKQFQRELLSKALEAIDTTPMAEKDITSMTMAIDVRKIPAARKRIEQFRREMCTFLEDGNQTQVFNLGIQLYPLSKNRRSQ